MWLSRYGNIYFGVGTLIAGCAGVVCFLLAVCLVCIMASRRRSSAAGSAAEASSSSAAAKSGETKSASAAGEITGCGCILMGFVAGLLLLGQFFISLSAATASGSGFAPAGAMYAAAAVPWLFVVPLAVAAVSPKLWRNHPGGPFGVCAFTCTAAVRAVGIKPALCWSLTVVSLTVTALMFLSMQGLCYCTNPTQISSWASRRVEPAVCAPGRVCHAYSLLGAEPPQIVVVAQWVVEDNADDTSAIELVLCELSGATQHVSSQSCKATPASRTIAPTRKIDYPYLSEDNRRIAHFVLSGLQPLTGYRAELRLTVNSRSAPSTHPLFFRTVPALTDTTTPVTFVGGGDYYIGDMGLASLAAALQTAPPDAMFMFIGGDMSYANNMRTCFRRWDLFFAEVTSRTNAFGWQLPLVALPGNHESGGYIRAGGDPLDEKYYFYYEYFPHADAQAVAAIAAAAAAAAAASPAAAASTSLAARISSFHAHRLGAYFGVIALDSGCFRRVPGAQTVFLEATLKNWTGLSATERVFTVPMFHVPAFPGRVRSGTDDNEVGSGVRDLFVPLFDQYKVSMAFQFHEHVFFRSKPLNGKGEVQAATKDGVVYMGDGALGVWKSDRKALASGEGYTQVGISINFGYAATFFPSNKTLLVRSVQPTADTLKEAVASSSAVLWKEFDRVEFPMRE